MPVIKVYFLGPLAELDCYRMGLTSPRLSLIFSCIGHAYIHMFTAFYFTIVLAIERDWQQPFHELLGLWTPAALLVGLAALPAGWLADRWSTIGIMTIYFIGLGASSVVAGFMGAPVSLMVAMAGIGLFAAIYHPVGIPWVIRAAAPEKVGRMLAINGIFGSFGVGLAALSAGVLIELWGWRSAFVVPGVICLITGVVMLGFVRTGRLVEAVGIPSDRGAAEKGDRARVFLILLITMFVGGITFNAVQSAMPKLFEGRLLDITGGSVVGIGSLVALVYMASGVAQLIGGLLADRVQLRFVLLGAWTLQAPLLFGMAAAFNVPLVIAAFVVVSANSGALAAENMLLSSAASAKRQGLVFGLKFVIAFGAAPLAIELVATIQRLTGDLGNLFVLLGGVVAVVAVVLLGLPNERAPVRVSSAAPAE